MVSTTIYLCGGPLHSSCHCQGQKIFSSWSWRYSMEVLKRVFKACGVIFDRKICHLEGKKVKSSPVIPSLNVVITHILKRLFVSLEPHINHRIRPLQARHEVHCSLKIHFSSAVSNPTLRSMNDLKKRCCVQQSASSASLRQILEL